MRNEEKLVELVYQMMAKEVEYGSDGYDCEILMHELTCRGMDRDEAIDVANAYVNGELSDEESDKYYDIISSADPEGALREFAKDVWEEYIDLSGYSDEDVDDMLDVYEYRSIDALYKDLDAYSELNKALIANGFNRVKTEDVAKFVTYGLEFKDVCDRLDSHIGWLIDRAEDKYEEEVDDMYSKLFNTNYFTDESTVSMTAYEEFCKEHMSEVEDDKRKVRAYIWAQQHEYFYENWDNYYESDEDEISNYKAVHITKNILEAPYIKELF